jgi:hypothetical protein
LQEIYWFPQLFVVPGKRLVEIDVDAPSQRVYPRKQRSVYCLKTFGMAGDVARQKFEESVQNRVMPL